MDLARIMKQNAATYHTVGFAAILGMATGALLMMSVLQITELEDTTKLVAISNEMLHEPLREADPIRLTILSIGIDAEFEGAVGLTESGEVGVPDSYTEVGWYEHGPTPGELGPAVILGHVDSVDGPAVFYSLGQVRVGDEIRIERADGSVAIFSVTGYERPRQDEFPTERIYGDIDHAGLRLITCTGTYDRGELRYSHNLVVYATLTGVEES